MDVVTMRIKDMVSGVQNQTERVQRVASASQTQVSMMQEVEENSTLVQELASELGKRTQKFRW